MWREYRFGIAVLPRQSGKDTAMSMESVEACLRTPKTTGVYISLDNPMIRDILWDKTYNDPVTGEYFNMLQDNVPSEYVTWMNTTMVGRFHNGSRLKLQGYFQSGNNKNGVGSSFQRYAFTELALFNRENPISYIMPILTNEGDNKRLMVASTPRGKNQNPLWKLIESVKDRPDAKVIIRGIDDLNEMMRREGLPPVRTEAALEEDRDTMLKQFGNDRMFFQEYHCSFETVDAAAVYGEALEQIKRDGRVTSFNINPQYPVFVTFDIGSAGQHSDATSWIAWQWYNSKLFLFDSGEGHGKAVPEYVDDLRLKPWFPQLTRIVLPWDAENHGMAINKTPADMVREKFPNVSVLAKSSKVWQLSGSRSGDPTQITDIQRTRMALYNTIISDNPLMSWFLECLENYKYEFSYKLQQWSNRPLHDKHSHMMDALRYTVQATAELEYFGGGFEDQPIDSKPGQTHRYTQDWSSVWNKR